MQDQENSKTMTQFEFTAICIKNLITPSIVWELADFKELLNNDNLNADSLQTVIDDNF